MAVDAVRLWHASLAAAVMGDLAAAVVVRTLKRVQEHVRGLYGAVQTLDVECSTIIHQPVTILRMNTVLWRLSA